MPVSPGVARLITFLIGTILFAFVVRGIHVLRMALASRDWPRTEGLLLDVHMEERRGRDNDGRDDPNLDTFHPVVRYSYAVRGKKYESARLWYRTDALGDYGTALRAIRDIRKGQPVDVYYDPGDPARSVLIPGFETMNVATVAISSVMFVLFLFWYVIR